MPVVLLHPEVRAPASATMEHCTGLCLNACDCIARFHDDNSECVYLVMSSCDSGTGDPQSWLPTQYVMPKHGLLEPSLS
jgi:hypothetical protein